MKHDEMAFQPMAPIPTKVVQWFSRREPREWPASIREIITAALNRRTAPEQVQIPVAPVPWLWQAHYPQQIANEIDHAFLLNVTLLHLSVGFDLLARKVAEVESRTHQVPLISDRLSLIEKALGVSTIARRTQRRARPRQLVVNTDDFVNSAKLHGFLESLSRVAKEFFDGFNVEYQAESDPDLGGAYLAVRVTVGGYTRDQFRDLRRRFLDKVSSESPRGTLSNVVLSVVRRA